MAGLQARTPTTGFHPLFLFSKFVSFSLIALLLCAGWVGVCYLKSSLDNRSQNSRSKSPSPTPATTPNPVSLNVGPLAVAPVESEKKETKLVFSCTADKEFYHRAKHLSSHCERIALSETAAAQRGLKPCSICFAE